MKSYLEDSYMPSPDPVKEKIQSLCPDVMELKFGCEIYSTEKGTARIVGFTPGKVDYRTLGGFTFSRTRDGIGKSEILGSPITLAVVLRAMEKTTKMLEPYSISILPDGAFYDQKNGKVFTDGRVAKDLHEASKMRIRWNLLKDNYDDQDEATKAFIGSLLGV